MDIAIQKHIKNDWKNIGALNDMEINLVALIITIASFIFGFILGVAVGKFDNDNDNNWYI